MKPTSREVRETVTLLYEPVQRSCGWFESYIIYGNHCWEHQKLLPGISDFFVLVELMLNMLIARQFV